MVRPKGGPDMGSYRYLIISDDAKIFSNQGLCESE